MLIKLYYQNCKGLQIWEIPLHCKIQDFYFILSQTSINLTKFRKYYFMTIKTCHGGFIEIIVMLLMVYFSVNLVKVRSLT